MDKKWQQIIAFTFGIIFLSLVVAIALAIPNPTKFQYVIFKSLLSLSAAGIAAMIPGFLQVTVSNAVRAGGALAVFVVVYFYNPADIVAHEVQKASSDVRIVDYTASYPPGDPFISEIDVKMRNVGEEVAYIKKIDLKVNAKATLEDCRNPMYNLEEVSAIYELDIDQSIGKAISHSIKPNEVDRILLYVGRKSGGPTLSIYNTVLQITYDEDNKIALSEPFYLEMVGPVVAKGMTISKRMQKGEDCHLRNISEFKKVGIDNIYEYIQEKPEIDQEEYAKQFFIWKEKLLKLKESKQPRKKELDKLNK